MANNTTILLILVFAIMGLTLFVLLMTLVRETLFWYWRNKGVIKAPQDILHSGHETAILLKKNIEGLKAAEATTREVHGVSDAA